MTHPDPSDDLSRLRLPRLSPSLWVLLALAVGAAPWVATAITMLRARLGF